MELLTVIKYPASRGCGGARPNPSIIGGRSSCRVSCTPLHPLCTVCTTIAPRVLHFSTVHLECLHADYVTTIQYSLAYLPHVCACAARVYSCGLFVCQLYEQQRENLVLNVLLNMFCQDWLAQFQLILVAKIHLFHYMSYVGFNVSVNIIPRIVQ